MTYSAGDQLLRKDMSEAEREVRQGIVDDVYEALVNMICEDRDLDRDTVINILDRGLSKASDLVDEKLITDTKLVAAFLSLGTVCLASLMITLYWSQVLNFIYRATSKLSGTRLILKRTCAR